MTSRKEIAARLREAGEELDKNAPGNVNGAAQSVLFELFEATSVRDSNSYSDAFNRLADLIDPTCHDFGGEEGTTGENYDFACSACGWGGDMTKPNYCPNCGARVVRDAN